MEEFVRISDLTFQYADGESVLNQINLTVNEGEYLALVGPNGCGKTTLIRHLNALLLPTSGDVVINGLNTRSVKNVREIRRLVGMIFQNPDNQIVGMSVEEDVAFGPGNLGLPAEELRRRVEQVLTMTGLQGLEKRSPHTLSGGQKQLLAMSGLLAVEPKLIALDEPTASLDAEGRRKVLSLIKALHDQGMAIIHVTHNLEEVARADRVIVMDRGKIVADGSAGEILGRVEWLKDLGMDPPKVTELLWYLRQEGADLGSDIFTVGAAARAISDLLQRLRDGGNV